MESTPLVYGRWSRLDLALALRCQPIPRLPLQISPPRPVTRQPFECLLLVILLGTQGIRLLQSRFQCRTGIVTGSVRTAQQMAQGIGQGGVDVPKIRVKDFQGKGVMVQYLPQIRIAFGSPVHQRLADIMEQPGSFRV